MYKQRLSLATILGAFILIFTSCSDEPIDTVLAAQLDEYNNSTGGGSGTTGGGGTIVSGNFTATVAGQSFVADATAGTYATVNSSNVLTITGIKSSGEYIGIQLINPTVGTFVVNALGGNQTLSYRENSTTTDVYDLNTGSGSYSNTNGIPILNIQNSSLYTTYTDEGLVLYIDPKNSSIYDISENYYYT